MTVSTRSATRPERSSSESSQDHEEHNKSRLSVEDLKPDGVLSLTRISAEFFILGNLFCGGLFVSVYCLCMSPSRLWRPALFTTFLSLFHFLEFYTTARWNYRIIRADSSLTTSNGRPYVLAMVLAWLETMITSLFFPDWQSLWSQRWLQFIGLSMVLVGQFVRSGAMATAGPSFNHKVQHKRKNDHVLITWGLYSWLRHPSYFGFFWWAVGTQILLGNALSTPMFVWILWMFFYKRIPGMFLNSHNTPFMTIRPRH